jgi:Lipoprotein LpqB beta-propeller domain/Sporulation and spore germination
MAERRWGRRQVLRGLLLAGAGLAVPAGCGVPTGGRPIVDGTGPAADRIGGPKGQPPAPDGVTSPTMLVELFLAAVSGPLDTAEDLKDAENRARRFLTPAANRGWQPGDRVTVVRVSEVSSAVSGPGATVVRQTLRPVGTLGPRGDVGPFGGSGAEVHLEFTVVPNTDPNIPLLIDQLPGNLPSGLLLSSEALDNSQYYIPQLVYFWDAARRGLVPDLRYVPRTKLTEQQQQATVVNWLIAGPSDLVSSAATNILPTGTTLLGPVVVPDPQSGALVVNFSGSFQGVDLGQVMAELRWSLNPLWTKAVQLQIASRPQQVDGTSDQYLTANLADQSNRGRDAEPFCVVGGSVAGVDPPYPVPQVLGSPDYNKNVASAALTRDKRQVALVTNDKRLWLGRLDGAGRAPYEQADLTGQQWSRPAWLPNRSRVLVIVDGTLYAVDPGGVSNPVLHDVSAFSVAPDGYRIAFVSGSDVTVAALRDNSNRLTLGTPRQLNPGLKEVSGVAWTRLDRVLVAWHATDGWSLAEMTIDGAIIEPWTVRINNPIASVVAYPRLPSQPSGSGQVMVQTSNGLSYRAFQGGVAALTQREPPAGSTGKPTGATNPTAPFYLD